MCKKYELEYKRKGRCVSEEEIQSKCLSLGLIYIDRETKNKKSYVIFQCSKHLDKGNMCSAWTHFRESKIGCPYCSGKYKTTDDYKEEEGLLHPHLRVQGEYRGAHKKVEVECLICNTTWCPEARSLLYGEGCPVCAKQRRADHRRKTQKEFEQDLYKVNPNIIIKGKYVGAHTLVKCGCRIHNNEWESIPSNLLNKSAGCPMCAKERFNTMPSIGEQKIASWLLSNNIEYMSEHKMDGCVYKKQLRFDFYLPNLNTVIEYDGAQHFIPVGWGANTQESLLLIQARDTAKNEYCKKNGIRLLRIPYTKTDEIDEILNKEIKEENYTH